MEQLSGPMKDFNLQCFLDAANELVRSDEVLRGLHLLDNLPAWYRDNPPLEVVALKNEIMARMATASFYATDAGSELETPVMVHEVMKHTVRGSIISSITKFLNQNGLKPNLYDTGPGEFWTPKLLISEDVKFQYIPIWVNYPSYQHYLKDFQSVLGDADPTMPSIYYACEIIEHLYNEAELRYEMNRKVGALADIVEFSTPLHSFDTNCPDWKTTRKDLGHLRAYTPTEFFLTIQRLFPEYDLTMFKSQPMHIHGVLRSSKFELIKNFKIDEVFK